MSRDPWSEIKPPKSSASFATVRVNPDIRWNFFWARDLERKCLLILSYDEELPGKPKVPKLREIEVRVHKPNEDHPGLLVFRLLDSAHRDIFYRLCQDIMEGASTADAEQEACEIAIQRTWRWHHLLRGGGDGRLSNEEQKGLIGELLVLEKYLLTNLSTRDSLHAWQGPLGATKDFEVGRTCIEAKARKGSAVPYVRINSEFQLDIDGIDHLFLFVVDLDRATEDMENGESLTTTARRIRAIIEEHGDSLEIYEERLQAAGFQWFHDYSTDLWVEGRKRLHEVTASFPAIRAADIQSGIANVTYAIGLLECEDFLVPPEQLVSLLTGVHHGD